MARCGRMISTQIDLQQLRGPTGEPGAPGAQGTQGPKGDKGDKDDPGSSDIARLSTTAPDMPNFQPGIVITESVPVDGGWLMLARVDAINTSANDDTFRCEISVGGQQVGDNSTTVAAATTKAIDVLSFSVIDPSQAIDLVCEGGPTATFDLTNVRFSAANLL
jgi:hypothetical protein